MKITLILVLFLVALFGYSQQETQFSQYYTNSYFFNPAASGLTKTINIDLGLRKQWMGIEGSPQSFYGMAHSEIRFDKRNTVLDEFNQDEESIFSTPKNSVGKNKHVVGGKIFADQIGPFKKSSVMASYAFHLRFTQKTMVSFGVSAGISNWGINSSKVILLDQDDAQYNDFLSRNSNQTIFDMNAGLVFYGEQFQLGIASNQLLENDLVMYDVTTKTRYGRHWFMYGMYDIGIQSSKISVEPHFMVQIIENAPISLNIGTRFHFDKRYWVNVAYRVQDALTLGAGLNFAQNLRVGYSYDIAIGKVQKPTNYVHELSFGLIFGRNIKKELQD